MSANFALGLFALVVAMVTLIVRFVIPPPERTVENPYAHTEGRSTFTLVAFGIVPLLASIAFFAAWMQEEPDAPPPVDGAVVHADVRQSVAQRAER